MKCKELEPLNKLLKKNNKHFNLYIVGGYYMQLLGLRNTNNDIDAYYDDSDSEIKSIINKFNENSKLELNNEVLAIKDSVYRFDPNVYYKFEIMSNLTVYTPYEEYFVIMKTVAASIAGDKSINKHINDLVLLAKYMGFGNDFTTIYNFFENWNRDYCGIESIVKFLQDNR